MFGKKRIKIYLILFIFGLGFSVSCFHVKEIELGSSSEINQVQEIQAGYSEAVTFYDFVKNFKMATTLSSQEFDTPNKRGAFIHPIEQDGDKTEVMITVAKSQISYKVGKMPINSVLRFEVTMLSTVGTGSECKIYIGFEGTTESIYSRFLYPAEEEGKFLWFKDELDLEKYAGKHAEIIFEADAGLDGDLFGDWIAWKDTVLVVASKVRRSKSIEDIASECRTTVASMDDSNYDIPFVELPIKAVYYFQPYAGFYNFWSDLDFRLAEEDFERIKGDGFNSIILMVPWGEFQDRIMPIKYNDKNFDKLNKLIRLAKKHDLGVILRVGSHEIIPKGVKGHDWAAAAVLTDIDDFTAYMDCLREIARRTKGHKNLLFYFWSWEDVYFFPMHIYNKIESNRREFIEWLQSKHSLTYWNILWLERNKTWEDISLPDYHKTVGFKLKDFWAFHDEELIIKRAIPCFIKALKEGNPEAIVSVQPRVDPDSSYDHRKTFILPQGYPFVVTWFGPYMYAHIDPYKSIISPEEGAMALRSHVKKVAEWSGLPMFFDQLFFYQFNAPPNLPHFKGEAEQINFIREAIPQICCSEDTLGYSLWTWRDYVMNEIYSPGFEEGFEQWKYVGNPDLVRDSFMGEFAARVDEHDHLLIERYVHADKEYTFSFFHKSAGLENLRIEVEWKDIGKNVIASEQRKINLLKSTSYKQQSLRLMPPSNSDSVVLTIIPSGNEYVLLDEIQFYKQVDSAGLYDLRGKARRMRSVVVQLNLRNCP